MTSREAIAFTVSLGAGLATAIGAAIVGLGSSQSPRFLSASMAVAAGVMIYVSINEIFAKSFSKFQEHMKLVGMAQSTIEQYAYAAATGAFFGGVILTALLNLLVHRLFHVAGVDEHAPLQLCAEMPHSASPKLTRHSLISSDDVPDETRQDSIEQSSIQTPLQNNSNDEEITSSKPHRPPDIKREQLLRASVFTGIAIALHNFPEGLATFMSMMESYGSGIPLSLAIAIHNIPEGICVAVPILFATQSRWKAFIWGTLSGLSEPIGAGVGWAILSTVNNHPATTLTYAILFGIVAGMMTFISFAELLPTAIQNEDSADRVTFWIFLGIAVMALSLVLFKLAGQ